MGEKVNLISKKPEETRGHLFSKKQKNESSRSSSPPSPVGQILHLQQTRGNRAVQRLLKSGKIQAKLKIGKPNDKYEQEADRVADKVLSMPEPKGSLFNGHSSLAQRQIEPGEEEKESIQTKPLADQITPLVQRQADEEEEPVQTKLIQRQENEEEEPIQAKLLQRQENEEEEAQTKLQRQAKEEEEEPVQAKPAPNQTPALTSNIESSVNSLKGGGQALPESTRSYFEPRFGSDFSGVRIHNNSQAAETAKSINAKAFTTGKDVVFGAGQYSPETSTGKKLLAHELTHVTQQTGVSLLKKTNSQPGNQYKKMSGYMTRPKKPTKGITATRFPYISINGERRLQRVTLRTNDGKSYLQLTVPDGTYVLEAANIPAMVQWHLKDYSSYADIYATASQHTPRHIYGLNADPHTICHTRKNIKRTEFRVKPGKYLESKKGLGSTKVQGFRHNRIWSDPTTLEVLIRFHTVPLLNKVIKGTKLVTRRAFDMDAKRHVPFYVAKGGTITQSKAYNKEVTDGYTVSKGRKVGNELSSQISSELGANIEIFSAKVGSNISTKMSVEDSIDKTVSKSVKGSRTLTQTVKATGPGNYVVVPTARVYSTPIEINQFEDTGRFTSTKKIEVYTIIYNPMPSLLNADSKGKPIIP